MAAMIVIVVYVVVGAGAAVGVAVSGRGGGRSLLVLVLWPFLLPAMFLRESPSVPRGDRERDGRLGAVSRSLREAFEHAGGGADRERRVVEAFLARLWAQERDLANLEAALSGAPETVRPRLEDLRDRSRQRIDEGIIMLDEMVAQLTLLRFSGLARGGGEEERRRMEDLMARVEAQNEAEAI